MCNLVKHKPLWISWQGSKIISELAAQTPDTVSILVELEKIRCRCAPGPCFNSEKAGNGVSSLSNTVGRWGCEAQTSRVGETDRGHFIAARHEFGMMADSGFF